jgi:hypothetical protein
MTIKNQYDDTENENSKDFTVPAGMEWKIHWVHVRYTSTATVGNRQIRMTILDDEGTPRVRFDVHAGAVQAASLERHYEFMQGIYRETSFVDGALQVPMPHCLRLEPGWTLRIADASDVDANDDMVASLQYEEKVSRIEI